MAETEDSTFSNLDFTFKVTLEPCLQSSPLTLASSSSPAKCFYQHWVVNKWKDNIGVFYDHYFFTDFFLNLDQHSIYSRSKDFLQHLQRAKNNSSICFLSKTHGSCQQLLWLRPRNMQMWLWWWNPSGICSVIKGFYFYYLLKKIIGSKKKVAQKMSCCFFGLVWS